MNATLKPAIAVLDSGIGGLTILNTLQQSIDAYFFYVADYEYFPYGILSPEETCKRLAHLFSWLEKTHGIDFFVIACNTASTSSLSYLRRKFKKPIIGVVPPIKLAAMQSKTKRIAVLATEQTALNDYTHNLVRDFAQDCHVAMIGSRVLVEQAENKIHNRKVDLEAIRKVIDPLLQDAQIDAVALSCTHFPHLIPEFEALGLRPKNWVLPNDGVAKRVAYLLKEHPNNYQPRTSGSCDIFLKKTQDLSEIQDAFMRLSKLPVKAHRE